MIKEKYYIETSRSDDLSHLTRNSKELMVSVYMAEEKKQCIHIYLTKNGNENSYGFPKTDEYNIVKMSSQEEFEKAYNTFLRNIHHTNSSNGEFYLMKRNNGQPNGMAWYSDAQQDKMGIQIQFYNDPKDFSIKVELIKTWQGVQHFRRAGNFISAEQFNLFYRGVLSFLHDSSNYQDNYKSLVEQFENIRENRMADFQIDGTWNGNNRLAIDALQNRIASIEKRLMEFDNDPLEERFKMRGELEGLKFALNVIRG